MSKSTKKNIEAVYPLSPMQQGMLFHTLMDAEGGAYFEQTTFKIRGNFKEEVFLQAVEKIIQRHGILRTGFVYKKLEQQLQVVHKSVELPVQKFDWRDLSTEEREEKFKAFLIQDKKTGFNLSKAPLIRVTIIRFSDDIWQAVWSNHHLLLDGWSLPLLLKELFLFYEALVNEKDIHLPPARQYRDYILWQQKQDMQKAQAFWQKLLQGFDSPTPLTVKNFNVPADAGNTYDKQTLPLSAGLTEKLQAIARKNQLTLNTLVQGVWAILLARYAGQDDVVFGATVSGRPPELEGVESIPGLFINTLPIRVQLSDEETAIAMLKKIQSDAVAIREYEYSPLAEVQTWSDIPGQTPLFESIVIFENYPVDQSMNQQKSSLEFFDVQSFERTNYPITVVAAARDVLVLELAYEAKLFSPQIIEQMLAQMKGMLEHTAADPQIPLGTLPLLSPDEIKKMTVEWNQVKSDFPQDICVHQLLEQQVEKYPQATALQFGDEKMTYEAFNRNVNQMARYLDNKGVKTEDRVAIFLERSFDLIISLFAVMKAGSAYVPLDPTYPDDRINYILEDCGAECIITQNDLAARINQAGLTIINLDTEKEAIAAEAADNPENRTDPQNLAYIIYTSGSTGKPKGTLLPHYGAINTGLALGRHFKVLHGKSILQFASIGFDASVAEILAALLNGATLHLVSRETILSESELPQLLREQKISTIILPPSVLSILDNRDMPDLQVVGSAGEACSAEVVARWSPGRDFVNGYGPTEVTVCGSLYHHDHRTDVRRSVPIGRPMENVKLYVLDEALRPQPVGVPGELHISGAGLARGYLNRPDLSAEKFIPDPFCGEAGARMYKTGDLVRYLPDGMLEFVGRIDFQIKIRGFRIELGEIESVLNAHPAIRDAVVIARQDNGESQILVGYYIANEQQEIDPADLVDYLSGQLPDYMIPSAFIKMEAFPLTSSGKVNRRALPAPEAADLERIGTFVAPRNQVEEILAGIWRRILKTDKIGVTDNFFNIGGHSLLATQLISRIRDAFEVDFPLQKFFETPTIEALAMEIEKLKIRDEALVAPPLEPTEHEGKAPVSFAQQRLWFLDLLAPGGSFYNIPTAIRLKGKLDIPVLESCINEIIRRHETLRTTFANVDGDPLQVIKPELTVSIPVEDLSKTPESERGSKARALAVGEAGQSFNLEKGPLFRIKLIKLDSDDHVALFTLHHIISDGWSMGVLVQEVAALYEAFVNEQESPLPDLPVQYADFAVWQRNWLQGEVLDKQMDFWKNEIGTNPPVLDLPTDYPRPSMQTFEGRTIEAQMPKTLSDGLVNLSQKEGVTLFMTLLAAFQTLMHRYSGQDTVLVGSPIANRTHSETEKLIGFFVNTLVLKADFSENPGFRSLLKQVRQRTLSAYAHQDLPFEQLVEVLQPDRDMSHAPIFQVAFILQNAPFDRMELPGVTIHPFGGENKTAKYDLSLYCIEAEDGIRLSFEYNTDLFKKETIERMIGHYRNLLEQALADMKKPLDNLRYLAEAERELLFKKWNATERAFPADRTVHQLFEQWAEKQPDQTALVFAGETMSYAELNTRANQLAHYLRKKGLGPDDIVGISLPRSLDVPVAVLAILKAGGAFLPIDPTYPQERIAYMIEDSGIATLITHKSVAGQFDREGLEVLALDSEKKKFNQEAEENPPCNTIPENLAYVIYTSGSTGRPKGTMLQHQGLCNLSQAQQKAFSIQPRSRILQFAPMSFDASVWETVMGLLNGAALVLSDQESLTTGQGLLNVLKSNDVTTVTLPPSVLAVMPEDELPELKTIVTAGEKCTTDLVRRWGQNRQFVNAYGPTETTVCASMYDTGGDTSKEPPIGRAVDNFQLYVLDKNWQAVPIGVPGELCVGGVGLARGYLKRPHLTADKFIPDPFSGRKGSRLYRTGDLVRYLPDGNLEFMGRIDFQVKLRGFRIELGEIEAVLTKHDSIRDAAVLVREDTPGDQRLVAYYVSEDGADISGAELRGYLKQQVPDYMVPSIFVVLETMPLTPSGKVDRKALPKPDQTRRDLESEYVAPRNENEEKLAAMVGELLNLEKVGVYDNFFELGGHSLLATKFMSRIRETFGVEMPLRKLFENPTVAGIAESLLSPDVQKVDDATQGIEHIERGNEDLASLLEEVEGLSDEEVQSLLNSESDDLEDEESNE